MIFCAFDCETTGLDTENDRMIEWAAILLEFKSPGEMKTIASTDQLIKDAGTPPITELIEGLTGISQEQLDAYGHPFPGAFNALLGMFKDFGFPDFFLAHNKKFDESMFRAEMKRHKEALLDIIPEEALQQIWAIPWICSIDDVEHPDKRCMTLSHLALDYGVAVDPEELHRALDDVRLLVKMLVAAKVDMLHVTERARIPWAVVRAKVPSPFGRGGDGGIGKEKAKACGFSWQTLPRSKEPVWKDCWVKRVKEDQIEKEREALGYEIVVLEKK